MNNYDDIRNHSRYKLKHHQPMSMWSRAAQFSPFAALTGYDDEIDEAARLTDRREEMTEDELNGLNQAFQKLLERASDRPLVSVTYFQPDERKDGGEYVSYTGRFRFFDETERILHFTDRTEIPVDDVFNIEMK